MNQHTFRPSKLTTALKGLETPVSAQSVDVYGEMRAPPNTTDHSRITLMREGGNM